MSVLKNQRHELFCQEVAKGVSGPDAYIAAGYDVSQAVASASASRLLGDVKIQDRINEIQQAGAVAAAKSVQLTQEWVLERLMRNAAICMGDEKVRVVRVLKSRTKDEDGGFQDQVQTVEIEVTERDPAGANRALELLGKERGMFIDRKEIGTPGEFEALTEDELQRKIARALDLGGSGQGGGRAEPPADPKGLLN